MDKRQQRHIKQIEHKRIIERAAEHIILPHTGLAETVISLEPRFMFDAAGLATGAEVTVDATAQAQIDTALADAAVDVALIDDATAPAVSQNDNNDLIEALATVEPPGSSQEIIFVDSSVNDYQTLLSGINQNVEVIMLDANRDGVEQIAEILAGRSNINAIHIISHGDTGQLHLGNTILTAESMQGEHVDELAIIGQALSSDADILIYGCNFAAGEYGQQAAETLAKLTGADVAASDDATGATELGGDWDLEVQQGDIETRIAIEELAQHNWLNTLVSAEVNLDPDSSQSNNGVYVNVTPDGSVVDVTDSDAIITDVDDTELASLTIDVVAVRDGNAELLTIAGAQFQLATTSNSNVTVGGTTFNIAYDAPSEIITITNNAGGDAPIVDVNTLLTDITYKNIAAAPTAGYRAFNFTADDGDTDSALQTSSILVGSATDLKFETINGGFEEPVTASTTWELVDQTLVLGWDTTDPTSVIEIWDSGFNGVTAQEGNQFAELNANNPSTLSQTLIDIQPGGDITYSFFHRGRAGVDTMELNIIDTDSGSIIATRQVSTDNTAWVEYSGTFTVPVTTSEVDVTFTAISTATGSLSVGNFLDDAGFTFSGPTPDLFSLNEDAIQVDVAPGLIGNDLDANLGTAATVSAVNGNAANVGTQITLASGALLTVDSTGAYTYDTNSQFDYLNSGQTGNDSFFYTFNDGDGNVDSTFVNIAITGVNDVPVIDLDFNDDNGSGLDYQNPGPYTAGDPGIAIVDSDVSITDPDSPADTIQSASITLTNPQTGDVLIVGALPVGITATGSGTSVITLSGIKSFTDYETALKAITFSNANAIIDGSDRTIEFTVNDGTIDSAIATATIDVFGTPIVDSQVTTNTQPTITGTWDEANGSATGLQVTVDGTTYTLGTDAALTTDGSGNWS
ncbi:MAG: hypothetical protein DRQ58_03530, partial [Gammaproteobacteria bacterium]